MAVFFFLLWIIFNGRVTPEIVLFGIGISALLTLFICKVFGYSLQRDKRIFINLPIIVLYCLNLIVEIVKASVSVMKVALGPHARPEPVVVEFRSGLQGDLMNVILANSITLTPGTITIFQEKDHFVVHALKEEYAEGIENCSFVTLLRRFK
ncbi:MAG: Na+/H+ antiporter subunit E [Lachnospiraceae bacterium]|nr:Na+/H+ antiporter subunit E [Lachnospiraceae bacterium]